MTYKDLDKNNIEDMKFLYEQYLYIHAHNYYSYRQPMSFEEYLQSDIVECTQCNNWTDKKNTREVNEQTVCESCLLDNDL